MSDDLIEVMNEEYDKIDRKAEREKQKITYRVELVQKNYDGLTKTVGTEDKRKLLDFVKEALREIEKLYTPVGPAVSYIDPESVREAILLGWIETKDYKEKSYCCLTGSGRQVIEDYYNFKEHL